VCLYLLFAIQAQSLKSFASSDPGLRDEIQQLQILVGLVVGAVLLGHIAFVVVLGLRSSLKVAGPIYRLKKAMAEVESGNLSVRIRLRQGDQLTEVAEAFNRMADTLKARAEPPDEEGEEEGEADVPEQGGQDVSTPQPEKPEVIEPPDDDDPAARP
jgi:nitrogen fixation/metabolism regulation signal transduction histidine kinase